MLPELVYLVVAALHPFLQIGRVHGILGVSTCGCRVANVFTVMMTT